MRFAFVKEWRHIWRVETICRVMQVTARGFRKWLTRAPKAKWVQPAAW
jgi:putative transposase